MSVMGSVISTPGGLKTEYSNSWTFLKEVVKTLTFTSETDFRGMCILTGAVPSEGLG